MGLPGHIKRMLGVDKPNTYFGLYVQRTNANLARYSGIAVATVQLILLINVLAHKGLYDTVTNRLNRAHAISYLVLTLVSLSLSFLAHRALKSDEVHGMVLPIIGYIIVAVVYGTFNSYIDALYGEPPLTFIFCLVASTCVFVIPPLGSININTLAFVIFSKIADVSGTFANNTVFHYWIGWIIVSFVSILRYQECRYGASHEQALHDASELDELTGLKNRRSLRMDFEGFAGRDFFVAMCDLDDFKGINDRYGHVVGDHVLWAFGDAIRSVFDPESCYRYGGDEFLVICPEISIEDFGKRVHAMRAGFDRRITEGGKLHVVPTTSVGFAFGHASGGEDLRAMVHLADANLYTVKRSVKGGIHGEHFMRAGKANRASDAGGGPNGDGKRNRAGRS